MARFTRAARPRKPDAAAPPSVGDLVSLQGPPSKHLKSARCFQVFEVVQLSANGSRASLQSFPQRVYFSVFEVRWLEIVERRRDRDVAVGAELGEDLRESRATMGGGEVDGLENGVEGIRIVDEAKREVEVEVQNMLSIGTPAMKGERATIAIVSSTITINEASKEYEHVPALSPKHSIEKNTYLPVLTLITNSISDSESEGETDSTATSPLSRTSSNLSSPSPLSRTSSSDYRKAPENAAVMWLAKPADEDSSSDGAQKATAIGLSY